MPDAHGYVDAFFNQIHVTVGEIEFDLQIRIFFQEIRNQRSDMNPAEE